MLARSTRDGAATCDCGPDLIRKPVPALQQRFGEPVNSYQNLCRRIFEVAERYQAAVLRWHGQLHGHGKVTRRSALAWGGWCSERSGDHVGSDSIWMSVVSPGGAWCGTWQGSAGTAGRTPGHTVIRLAMVSTK